MMGGGGQGPMMGGGQGPMMIDPSRMSGIPRPDPNIPVGTITVRVIRGDLTHNMVGVDVTLTDGEGHRLSAKTEGETARATFSGLTGGPYIAHAKDAEGVELTSQSIELQPNAGIATMLVFPAGGPGAADSVARPDKSVAPNTIVVKAVDGEGKGISALDVVVGHMRSGETQVRELRAKTDKNGEAKIEGVDAKPTSGYLAEVLKDGARFSSKPFRISENMGSRVVIEVRPVSRDLGTLKFGKASRFVVQVLDDAIEVAEMLHLENPGTTPIDPGSGGLHIPLPESAVQATSVAPQPRPELTVSGHEALWRGPIPPGETEIDIAYVLAYKGDSVSVHQPMSVALDDVLVLAEKMENLEIHGNQLSSETQKIGGRTALIYRGPGVSAGQMLSLEVTGLPHSDPTWRFLAAGLSIAIVFGFGIFAFRGRSLHQELLDRKERLLTELVALESKGGDQAKRARKREELTSKLADTYRELDEVNV